MTTPFDDLQLMRYSSISLPLSQLRDYGTKSQSACSEMIIHDTDLFLFSFQISIKMHGAHNNSVSINFLSFILFYSVTWSHFSVVTRLLGLSLMYLTSTRGCILAYSEFVSWRYTWSGAFFTNFWCYLMSITRKVQ